MVITKAGPFYECTIDGLDIGKVKFAQPVIIPDGELGDRYIRLPNHIILLTVEDCATLELDAGDTKEARDKARSAKAAKQRRDDWAADVFDTSIPLEVTNAKYPEFAKTKSEA